ncbi:uncharacterized protein LOC126678279 [Mercurialis annua]|uniref:uncharacterized protein LOC126678279 n=1 Tax=Mercurialis annua TaxID=3986 RepID=UPI0021604D7C|nr:uncharacterized protein LOC126678279 [Mercurialis annua]
MKFDVDEMVKVPIWIQFPKLPWEFWSPTMLGRMASLSGKPMFTDQCTNDMSRLSYARVLVEMEVLKEFPHEVILEDEFGEQFVQRVVYEWRPPVCSKCRIMGHTDAGSKVIRKEQKEWVQKKADSDVFIVEKVVRSVNDKSNKAAVSSDVVSKESAGESSKTNVSPQPEASPIGDKGKGKTIVTRQQMNQSKVEIMPSGRLELLETKGSRESIFPQIGENVLETRVTRNNTGKIWKKMGLKGWKLINNNDVYEIGRIWVMYNEEKIKVLKTMICEQMIHCMIDRNGERIYSTFIYGENDGMNRRRLWENIQSVAQKTIPWVVLSDFNVILRNDDRIGGNLANATDCEEFQNCVDDTNLLELRWSGHHFTWTNNQQGEDMIWRKIDRVFVSVRWIHVIESEEKVLNPGLSDHSPLIVVFIEPVCHSFKPFNFFYMWTECDEFLEIVRKNDSGPCEGYKMYRVVSKLKRLKADLKLLNKVKFSNITTKVQNTKKLLEDIQSNIQKDPFNVILMDEEHDVFNHYKCLLRWEENFYKQKSRFQRIEPGNLKTSFFHKPLRQKTAINRIN